MTSHLKIPAIFTIILILSSSSVARFILTPTTPLPDNETLISASGIYALGFFNPNPKNSYVGIWYNQIPEKTVVWVANRVNPVVNLPGVLSITATGTLTIIDKDLRVVWSSNTSTKLSNPIAQLLDNGNFVVKELNDDDASNYAWQGFYHLTDTLLAGMKVGMDFTTGMNHTLTAWSSPTDPTPGPYHLYVEIRGDPEFFLANGTRRIWRTGRYDGAHFSGFPTMSTYQDFNFSFVNNKSGVTYSYQLEPSIISRLFVNSYGSYQRAVWVKDIQQWNLYWSVPKDRCDPIITCGAYALCDMDNTQLCSCLTGFELFWPALTDGSDGCVRENELDCKNGTDGFVVVKNVNLPESEDCVVDFSLSLDECRSFCLRNCSCTAYASAIASNGSGCVIWTATLVGLRNYNSLFGQDLYVRLNAADVPKDL